MVGALILAAGKSARMGGDKLTAMLGDRPVIAHVADAVAAAGLPALVVVRPGEGASGVRAALAGHAMAFFEAADAHLGMAHSIAAGIAAVPAEWSAAILCLGDMPFVSPMLLRRLAEHGDAGAVVVPRHAGRRGNPVLWGCDYFPALTALTGDRGARDLLVALGESVATIESPDDGIFIDVDTPDALVRARVRLEGK